MTSITRTACATALIVLVVSPSGRSAAALHRHRIPCELRSASTEGICYEVKLPLDVHTDTISEALISLKRAATVNVKWEQQKQTK